MYGIITTISFFFLVKSIIFESFYSNYILFLLYPIELASLSLINESSQESTFVRWIVSGWLGLDYEYNVLNQSNQYIIFIAWILSALMYQLYYIVKEKIKKNELSKWSFYSYNIKYCITNYLTLYLWNLNSLLNINNLQFSILFFNNIMFNMIMFWFPGILFNYIYGEYLYIYRIKYDFLLQDFNPKYKYFNIVLLLLKSLNGIFITLYRYQQNYAKYALLVNLSIYYYIIIRFNIFIKDIKYYISLIILLSYFIIALSIVENYNESYHIVFFIFELIMIIISFIIILFHYFKNRKIIIRTNDIELNNITAINN